MFDDTERDPELIDPPDNTGGGGKADSEEESGKIDPPDNTGGGN